MNNLPLICPNPDCGTANTSDAKHCMVCGTRLGQKCLRCWADNDASALHCKNCGRNLKGGHFGLPQDRAEAWARQFQAFEWRRNLQKPIESWCTKLADPLDLRQETVIVSELIQSDKWLPKIVATGRVIGKEFTNYSPWPEFLWPKQDQAWGALIITDWRLCVLDSLGGAETYPFDNLASIGFSRQYRKDAPIFDLDFGPRGTVEIWRRQMTEVYAPSALSRFLMNARTAATANYVTAVTSERAGKESRENMLVVAFFEDVIRNRQQNFG